jgi:hypothetical protein
VYDEELMQECTFLRDYGKNPFHPFRPLPPPPSLCQTLGIPSIIIAGECNREDCSFRHVEERKNVSRPLHWLCFFFTDFSSSQLTN